MEMRARDGQTSAFAPGMLLEAPIWNHPRTAAGSSTQARTWRKRDVQHNVEVVNPLGPTQSGDAHGLLRWLDLDVILALSHGALRSQSLDVAILQADALRWMGYDDLLSAPYDTLRASITRLRHVDILHWHGPERPEATSDHLDRWRLLDHAKIEEGASLRRGRGHVIIAHLSQWWAQSLKNGQWQELNLDAYAHLVRSYRRYGLARVLYAYLTAQRLGVGQGEARVSWADLDWVLTPRKSDGIRRRYATLNNPNNPLPAAAMLLAQAGVIDPIHDDPQYLHCRFVSRGIPAISHRFIQQVIPGLALECHPWAKLLEATPSEPSQGTTNPALPAPPTAPALPTTKPPPELLFLQRQCRIPASLLIEARSRGWTDMAISRVLLVATYRNHLGEVRRPGGYVATIIRDGVPTDWTIDMVAEQIDVPAARAWTYGPDGPLRHLKPNSPATPAESPIASATPTDPPPPPKPTRGLRRDANGNWVAVDSQPEGTP
jgi:hypothetical protein